MGFRSSKHLPAYHVCEIELMLDIVYLLVLYLITLYDRACIKLDMIER
jgi:hypothetical protein